MIDNSKIAQPDFDKAVDFLWSLPTERVNVCAIHPTRPGAIRGRTFERVKAGDRQAARSWLEAAQRNGFGCYFYVNDLTVMLGPKKPKAPQPWCVAPI
jgi:hypothetical protein